ncbi:MAG TPA: amino acid adenylation domain-containing protein [Polyangiaceae bacterium]|nr:amino acid adenylation domain-containing protein [Polyangiaceae bacterium]
MPLLGDLFSTSASRFADRVAVVDASGAHTYRAIDALANRVARALAVRGVGRGDRVGISVEKSAKALACMQGILRVGAAYVPLDAKWPAARRDKIVRDCHLEVVIDDAELDAASRLDAEPLDPAPHVTERDLAYILYTSGSTGAPKGVCIDHRGARAFVDWAAREVGIGPEDRLANHAAFHFDLSVFDLYAAFAAGAAVCIVPDAISLVPKRLVAYAAEHGITVWYSVPSALALMVEQAGMSAHALPSLRAILFAGEAYPRRALARLRDAFPATRLLNLYGPTETNVCTFHEVADVDGDVPIGRACCGDEVWAVAQNGARCEKRGDEGELWVSGPTVMRGYWGQDPQVGPYATGDLVRVVEPGVYAFVGRKDRMLKVRGHRIEPAEVEAALSEHENVREAAVFVRGEGLDARIVACIVPRREPAPSLLAMKGHSAERLPRYMILDELVVVPNLPRTANGKLDHERLA